MSRDGLNVLEALNHIDPAGLTYSEWVGIGMGLKQEGFGWEDWASWSQKDPARYHNGECQRKWNSFKGSDRPIAAGTIINMALSRGWTPWAAAYGSPSGGGYALDWEDEVSREWSSAVHDGNTSDADRDRIINRDWLENQEVEPPKEWNPAGQIMDYLNVLFKPDEYVAYSVGSFIGQDERYHPNKGTFNRTAGQIIEDLKRYGNDIGAALGDYNQEAGAWIRFNPLDGKGVKDENVTAYRFAMIESDDLPVEEQNAIIRKLELPVAALVHSGGKSLHAIVRVDAPDYEEYTRRVDFLYELCTKEGLKPDRSNRNPSRLSRLPGIIRGNQKQFLVDTNIGKKNWNEWREWLETIHDNLPDTETLSGIWDNLPELAPPLIENVLRQGHKMLLAGPSKAGKSFSLIELCISIAEGRPWLGFPCTRGKVLYVNLELDRASCLHRFKDVYTALGWNPLHLDNIDIWNLRGKAVPMDKLAPKLIRRAKKKNYIAIVIDPIYKIITGDENSADQMARFCNQFDLVCNELGCAVIYCHHHSKGDQGGKRSMDRASGSGVFARDPDALLDLIELPVSEDLRSQVINRAVGGAVTGALRKAGKLGEASLDDLCTENGALEAARTLLTPGEYKDTAEAADAAKRAAIAQSAWRIEGTLREFPKFGPVNVWFAYPVHRVDASGVLGDVDPDMQRPAWQKAREQKPKRDPHKERLNKLEDAFAACDMDGDGKVKMTDLISYIGKSEDTIKRWLAEFPSVFERDNGVIRKV